MKEEKLAELLNELADATAEPVRPGLTEDIKCRIPHRILPHRRGRDTINIIIDLRISKLTAAAVIIITIVLWASFFGGRDATGEGIFHNSTQLIKYCLGGENAARSDVLAGMTQLYNSLVHQGRDVVYYGDTIDLDDSDAVLMHWKIADGNYKVIFGDLRVKTVGPEELIRLQARMLQNKAK